MFIEFEDRASDSPYVELVTVGRFTANGSTVRPSEVHWHMVFVKRHGQILPFFVAPLTSSGIVKFETDVEALWIKFKLGTFMPHLPARKFLDSETALPKAASQSFWLKGMAWQVPDFENADTFVDRLVRSDLLARDPLIESALRDPIAERIPPRTLRHRFMHATGLTQTLIRQAERAEYARSLLERGTSILDTVYEAGYFDQPHLTRALRRFVGQTPAEIFQRWKLSCHSVQDAAPQPDYPLDIAYG